MSKKEELEKWLDEIIEAHKSIWKSNSDFDYEGKHTDIYTYITPNIISVHGLVELAETLGCCVLFQPSCVGTRAVVKYKGVDLIEHFYD